MSAGRLHMECPMKTDQAGELFVSYAAGVLPSETGEALEWHLEACDVCRGAAQAQKSLWSALDLWQPPEVSSGFDQALFARIAVEAERPWYRRWLAGGWTPRPALPVAAACAAILAVLVLKGPLPLHTSDVPAQTKQVDIEQVERALDDIDMLKQLGVAVVADRPPRSSEKM